MKTILPVLFALLAFLARPADAAKPNVLFLFADDMRADSVAALGNPVVKTPNLDSIARRGFVFNNAYCLGGNSPAVCTPSRNMMLSGNAFFRWKDFQPPTGAKGSISPGDGPNFPLTMQAAGYETYHHGKRGNTATLIQAKFEHSKYLQNDTAERESGEPGKEIADAASAFIKGESRDKARPFFMYLAFGNPHDPRVAAKKYLDQYDRAKIPLMKNYKPVHPFDNGEMTVRDEQLSPWPRTEDEIRKTLHEYYATITAMDFHIGRILQALKDGGQFDNTLILFSADQGIAVGSHGLLGKQNLYDAGMKSPLFFAGPGIPKGRSDALVYLLDIYPTVADFVDAPTPAGIDGRSFKPVIAGAAKAAREELFFAYRHVQRAWRDDRWKIIRYPEVNVTQLFDLRNDPDEVNNLAGKPEHAARTAELLAKLNAAQPKFGDDLPLTVANPKPAAWTPPSNDDLKKAAGAAKQDKQNKKKKK
ncbi:MAG: sulfatase-like hydrolase/transferase [Verrucomicrobia bacterium]|nr:sulfatase-like hydrolase/transferase [Verrucomicrobiota bacterium]